MYGSLFQRDVFAQADRLQREMQQAINLSPPPCGLGPGHKVPSRRAHDAQQARPRTLAVETS